MPLPLPCIDISDADQDKLVDQLAEACSEHGFFLVTGHGVPQELISSCLQLITHFFALPEASKQRLLHNQHAKGYMPWGQQTLDQAVQTCGDTKETWAAMDESLCVPEDHPDAFKLPFHSPNQWPDEDTLPGFKPALQQLTARMKGVRDRVNVLMSRALGQPPDFFQPFFSTPLDMLRTFHYHSRDGSQPDAGVFGAGAHTDWGHVTYLITDGCPGLQIRYQGAWQDVPHVPGAFVCNIADLLQMWSGGRFKSTEHRVVIAPGVHRYSCAYFTVPAWDAWVQPLVPPSAAGHDGATGTTSQVISDTTTHLSNTQTHSTDSCKHVITGSNNSVNDERASDGSRDESSSSSGGCGVLVGPHGCCLAPGAKGVRVIDYIQAKYKYHFQDAGKRDA